MVANNEISVDDRKSFVVAIPKTYQELLRNDPNFLLYSPYKESDEEKKGGR